jgi:phosphoserine phosphatase
MRRFLCSTLVAGGLSAALYGQAPPPPAGSLPPTPQVIRIAYTAFESPDSVHRKGTLQPIVEFLRASGEELARLGRPPLEFELVLGNYYQVWSWFRSRQIDAAFVSPFTAFLLEREGAAIPVLELTEQGTRYVAKVAASGAGRDDPNDAYVRHLKALLDEARHVVRVVGSGRRLDDAAAAYVRPGGEATRLNFVAHLSSSGFVMPTLFALDWLDEQRPGPFEREHFWRMYFERARFTLHHGVGARRADDTTTDIFFSYSGRADARLKADSKTAGLGEWKTLGRGDARPEDVAWFWKAEPGIPPDVLVVRQRLLEEVLETEDRNGLADSLVEIAARSGSFTRETTYTSVRRYNVSAQTAFKQAVDRLFGPRTTDPTLDALTRRWFEQGRFDFTIDETLGFLRQDQLNSGVAQLALVLSGGGVKSLYQARHLDELYGTPLAPNRKLRNVNEGPTGQNGALPPGPDGPLTVRTIIGTSGGAMLAFYASLFPAVRDLTGLARNTASQRLFPLIDIPRIASVLAIVSVFVACLHLAKAFGWLHVPAEAGQPWQVPRSSAILVVAPVLLFAAALAMRWLRIPYIEDVPLIRGIEGVLFAVAAVLLHMATVCIKRPGAESTLPGEMHKAGTIGLLLGVGMIVTAIDLHLLVSDTDPADRILAGIPVLAGAGIVMAVAGLLLAAAGGRFGMQLFNAREYLKGLAIVLAVIGVSYLAIVVGIASGQATELELTWGFWIWTLAGGFVVSSCVVLLARHGGRFGNFVQLGAYSLVRDRVGGLTLSLGAAMCVFFSVAVVVWIVLVAPAVYGSDRARDALVRSLPDTVLRSEVFRSNLIVTGTLLADAPCPARQRPYVAGPLYSCFEGPAACVGTTSGQWELFRRPVPVRALQAVFASGSPFPVFPAHKVTLPNGCEVPLIDGGYAHNVPLEAAVAAEARQVLVINASPEEEGVIVTGRRVLSDLAHGAQRIFPFMFSRAQELDRSMARRLMVASLTPHPEDKDAWPFLLDFRPKKQDLVVRQAEQEIRDKRRIGHMEAWGTPLVAAVVRVAEFQAPPAARAVESAVEPTSQTPRRGWEGSRWLPQVRAHLETLLSSDPGVVAFDLDNTILRGDIGDALFLKIVAEMHYAGDREEFWALIPNGETRDALRAYWKQFQGSRPDSQGAPRHHYADPSSWPNGFVDYVVLFQRQYRELLQQPDGARRAYPWVVQLMTGMSEETVRRLSKDLWASEMLRGIAPQDLQSKRYGEFRIEGGVRVYGEVDDLLRRLQERGHDVWIITASNQFVADEAADRLRVPRSRVVGIRPRIVGGLLTADLESPITYREGKLQALVERGLHPRLVAGDSMTDYEMLKAAPVALVIDRGSIDRNLMTSPATWVAQPSSVLTPRIIKN